MTDVLCSKKKSILNSKLSGGVEVVVGVCVCVWNGRCCRSVGFVCIVLPLSSVGFAAYLTVTYFNRYFNGCEKNNSNLARTLSYFGRYFGSLRT